MSEAAVDVAAGVLIRADGKVLLAQRPESKVYAGFWEFPGGKVEAGETARIALDRELDEELAIKVECAYPWLTQTFTYPHATVRIHFFRVTAWQGEPVAREHQAFDWQAPDHMTLAPMLPANTPILRALDLPHEYATTNVARLGEESFLRALEMRLRGGLRVVELRERGLSRQALRALGARVLALCRAHRARLLVNADLQVAQEIGADGIHLSASQLAVVDERPPFAWVAASCGDALALAKAASLALDFVVVGPVVRGSGSTAPLGWSGFSALIDRYPLPVFAAGGLTRADLDVAWRGGAHGVATSDDWPSVAAQS